MPDYVSKAGGVGLAYVLTVEDLDSGWFSSSVGGATDTGSLLVTASFLNPYVTFSKGDGTEFYINLVTLVPTNASTASFITASNVYGPYGANSVISASIAATASYVPPGGASAAPPDKGIQYNVGGFFGATSSYTFDYAYSSVQHGYGNTATGINSYAQGETNNALSDYSHAEGYGTTTSASHTHTEGKLSQAYGQYSHAEGDLTLSAAESDHAEGFRSATGLFGYASRNGFSSGVGDIDSVYGNLTTTFTKNTILIVTDDSYNFLYTTTVSSSTYGGSQTTINLFDTSVSTGEARIFLLQNARPSAYSDGALFPGFLTENRVYPKHSEGRSIVLGSFGHSEGDNTIAYLDSSHAEGKQTIAYGPNSHAEGIQTYTGMFGYDGEVKDDIQINSVHGDLTAIFRNQMWFLAYVYSTKRFIVCQHSSDLFDGTNTSVQVYNVSELPVTGTKLAVFIPGSHLPVGAYVHLYNEGGHSEGSGSIAFGSSSHAEGYRTLAHGPYSHAEGGPGLENDNFVFSIAFGSGSHVEGMGTFASGNYSHAEGNYTKAVGNYSHAEGLGTIAYKSGQLAVGQYNLDLNITDLFVIGNGSTITNRSDIVNVSTTAVRITGSAIISSSLNVIGTSRVTGSANISGGVNLIGNQTITGSLFVDGNITAQQYIISSSVIYVTESNFSGSHIFGNTLDDTHQFTGSVLVTGSANFIGLFTANDALITGSLFGTSSWALQALTASFVTSSNVYGPFNADSILSASHAVTASFIDGGTF